MASAVFKLRENYLKLERMKTRGIGRYYLSAFLVFQSFNQFRIGDGCEGTKEHCPNQNVFGLRGLGIGKELIFLTFQSLVLIVLLILIELKYFNRIKKFWMSATLFKKKRNS